MAKLLLVEDDNNLREIYEARLQAEGYTIVSARDGEEALVVAKAEKPDLVISDVMMPKISGFEMLDILRNTDELKGVKVIMLTALGQSDDQKRADKLGADRYLVKSQVTLEDIVKVTHELLGDETEAAAPPAAVIPEPETKPEAATPAIPAPEPVAPSPAPEPTPAAEPVSEPAPKPTTASTNGVAESTAQEEADVEAKIEDFVAGASSEPATPATPTPATTVPEPTPTPVATPTATPAPAPTPTAPPAPPPAPAPKPAPPPVPNAKDDKLMADAVDSLVASTDNKDPEPPSPDTPTPAPKTTPIQVSVAQDEEQPEPEPPGGGEGSSKKIIKPLSGKPKKDINELLAEEEAREAQTMPGASVSGVGTVITEVSEDEPAGAPMPPPSATVEGSEKPSEPDPSSIAL